MVRPIPFKGDDESLVAALQGGHPGAMEALYDRYSAYVERVLTRIVNIHMDIPELLHDVFIQAFTSAKRIKDPRRLRPWLASLAVNTARNQLKRHRFRQFFCPEDSEKMAEPAVHAADMASREALRAVYGILDKLSVDERIAFSLRHIEEMELKEVAEASRVSLATVKRRLGRANRKFEIMASRDELLRYWLARGRRRERA